MAARKKAPSKADPDARPDQEPAKKPTPLGIDTALSQGLRISLG